MHSILPKLTAKGYQYFDWNIGAGDGSVQTNADQPYNCVTTTLIPHARNVVLMHDTKQTSVDAVQRIIDFGKLTGINLKFSNKIVGLHIKLSNNRFTLTINRLKNTISI